ncbi:MAG: hypothetical protein HOL31_02040 [Candidatus Scalindua sp.]|jgi:hypothetical protein|nr:hypothetical protein [Candidatus Scalindua sp.]MBT7349682.1 hypothetical protein [candidate division WWE3 bacterium]
MTIGFVEVISGTYGSGKITTDIFIDRSTGWYCIEGSKNVNQCLDVNKLVDGVNVENLDDIDYFTTFKPINTKEEFEGSITE